MPEAISHKTCNRCKQSKPVSEFHKRREVKDGLRAECKSCFGEQVTHYRHTEAGKAMRRREFVKYSSTEHGKAVNRKKSYKYKDQNPDRVKARMMVCNRVYKGTMERPSICSKCGAVPKVRLEAHHFLGYEREHWLDVIWLCSTCHREAEIEME